MKQQVIYCIEGPAGIYIGETENWHKRKNDHTIVLNYSLWLYGIDERPKIYVLSYLPNNSTKQYRRECEIIWQNHFRQFKMIVNDKTKALWIQNKSGKNNPFYGKKHTEKTKEKIRNKLIGHIQNFETRDKISKSHMGKKNPEHSLRMCGSNNPNSILDDYQVCIIKRLLNFNTIQQSQIARIFKVSRQAINLIKMRKSWK